MPLESANFVSDLVSSNPSSTDGMAQGDDHIRLLKAALQATFPNANGDMSAFFIPSGGIIDWSGSIASIPSGWALCDGANGTPDLRDRFVVGAGSTYTAGAMGGAATIALSVAEMPSHNHGGGGLFTTTQNGSHSHTGSTTTNGNHRHPITGSNINRHVGGNKDISGGSNIGKYTEYAGNHQHGLQINADGTHTHTVQVDIANQGSGAAHENRPPYYALAKIMKL